MYRTALRNVLAHKGRLLMTALAVMLGTAFVAGTMVFSDTFGNALRTQNSKSYTDIAVTVSDRDAARQAYDHTGEDSEGPALTEEIRKAVAALPGAAEARGVVSGFAGIADKKGALIGNGFSTTGTNYVPGADGTDPRYPLVDGRGPHGSGEIALDTKTAEKGGYQVGDTVRVAVNGPVMKLKLTGTLTTNDPRVLAGGSLAAFDTATAQQLYLSPGRYAELDVKGKPGADDTALLAAVKQTAPQGDSIEAKTGRELAAEQDRMIQQGTKVLSTFLMVFAFISLFVGIFIIANTFTMLVAQRTKELALLRAIGASRKQITRSVLVEALLVGLLASAAGLLAGIGIGAGMQTLVSAMDDTMPQGSLVIKPLTIAVTLLVGVLVTVLSALLPAVRASRIAPVAAMSSTEQPATQKSLLVRNTIGLLFTLAGAGSLAAGAGGKEYKLVGLGAGTLLIGVFVLTPLLARPLIALFAPLLRKVYGTPGKLAQENAIRNPRRTAATASALTIGVTLITALTVVGASVNKAVDAATADDLKADYTVAMQNGSKLSPEVAGQIAKAPGVSAMSVMREVRVTTDKGDSDYEFLTGVDAATIDQLATVKVKDGSADALKQGKLMMSSGTAQRLGFKVGDTMAVTYPGGAKGSLTVGAVLEANSALANIVAPDNVVGPHALPGSGPAKVLVKGANGADEKLKQALRDATGGNPLIAVKGEKDIKAENRQLITGMLNMMYGLLGMAVVIAVLGVVNTMAMSVFERRREIGMLRAIGLDRIGIRRMVRLESLLIALFGGAVGIGLGILVAWAGTRTMADSLKNITTVVPPLQILGFLVAAAVIGLLAALWPAHRAARMDILGAIKSE
ncbi:ABC transporter permease [Kitasatospora sp. NPDC059811]|uniref:ABC transporter permease n=1 Tax=Streptomycetaceae TaxID=2062 RepID=UPI0007AFB484|nr:FtsX-like permease family protein [Streptomyces sp. MJM8645]